MRVREQSIAEHLLQILNEEELIRVERRLEKIKDNDPQRVMLLGLVQVERGFRAHFEEKIA